MDGCTRRKLVVCSRCSDPGDEVLKLIGIVLNFCEQDQVVANRVKGKRYLGRLPAGKRSSIYRLQDSVLEKCCGHNFGKPSSYS